MKKKIINILLILTAILATVLLFIYFLILNPQMIPKGTNINIVLKIARYNCKSMVFESRESDWERRFAYNASLIGTLGIKSGPPPHYAIPVDMDSFSADFIPGSSGCWYVRVIYKGENWLIYETGQGKLVKLSVSGPLFW